MKIYHVLNGDSLKEQLEELDAEKIVLRECLIEGSTIGNSLEELFANRTLFFEKNYEVSQTEYHEKSIFEISKITEIEDGSEINLWFENDLFCQVNFWFAIHTLYHLGKDIFINLVSPIRQSWMGFGLLSYDELLESFQHKKELTSTDQKLIAGLWTAFQKSDWETLRNNAKKLSHKINQIEEVIEAHIERFPINKKHGRPQKSILKIIDDLENPTFPNVFKAFCKIEGIYGFGDLQVKRIMEELEI